jgi:hypothetical protein
MAVEIKLTDILLLDEVILEKLVRELVSLLRHCLFDDLFDWLPGTVSKIIHLFPFFE